MAFGDGLLAQPDLFPARQSGEPWGDEALVIRIAGTAYACEGLSTTQAALLRRKFGARCTAAADPGQATVPIRIFRVARSEFVEDGRTDQDDFELDYAPDAIRAAGYRALARLDWRPGLEAALWSWGDGAVVSEGVVENVLRLAVAYHLLDGGGVLLHSAAVAGADFADVFFGHSGAGKSTIARLGFIAGRRVLSDDMNALRLAPEGLVVEKLPFAGDFGASRATADGVYRVRRLCRLEQGEGLALAPLRPAPAVAALVECAPFVNRNPHRFDALMQALEAIAARRPVQVLTFARRSRVWDLLDA